MDLPPISSPVCRHITVSWVWVPVYRTVRKVALSSVAFSMSATQAPIFVFAVMTLL